VRGVFYSQAPHIEGVKPIDIFLGTNFVYNGLFTDVWWQWELDKDTCHGPILVQLLDVIDNNLLRNFFL
jgi:hypothetical protein